MSKGRKNYNVPFICLRFFIFSLPRFYQQIYGSKNRIAWFFFKDILVPDLVTESIEFEF